jgi:hypothetical protein
MEASGAMNFKPRMARIYTDKTDAQGGAWASQAALRFQIPSQASLHGILKTHRPLAPRAALLFRAEREILGMGKRNTHGCDSLAKRGGVLEKHPKAGLGVSFPK